MWARVLSLRALFAGALLAGPFISGPFESASIHAAEIDAATAEKVVAESTAQYAELFARQDAAGIAALFTPEAEYVDADGIVFHGRAVIEAELAATFAEQPKGKIEIEVVSIRPIADGVIVEEGGSTFQPEGDGPIVQSRYMALHARQADGTWLLAGVRELAPVELTPHERLKSLAWLIGDWREEAAGGVTKTSWKWSDDGVALTAAFTVRDPEGEIRTGTHRVGWDAERKQYRSWIFDSTGGFADGWWTFGADDTWSVRLAGVNAEGERIAATLTYAADGPDKLTITQHDRVRGGEGLPVVETRVVRQPPAPGAAAK
jgi:uncharacterized protein (TIGR02246 family)